jgi:hypothetical protein
MRKKSMGVRAVRATKAGRSGWPAGVRQWRRRVAVGTGEAVRIGELKGS